MIAFACCRLASALALALCALPTLAIERVDPCLLLSFEDELELGLASASKAARRATASMEPKAGAGRIDG
ncbi:MAG: hypothetical protein ABI699_08855 [Caldimonas sp.]